MSVFIAKNETMKILRFQKRESFKNIDYASN